MSKSKAFCAYPYVSLFIANSGKQLPCCYAQNDHASEIPNPNISEAQHMQDLWNSHYLKKLREMMSDGKFPAACNICEKTEQLKGMSHRQRSLEQFAEQLVDVEVDGGHHVSSPIRHLDLRLGNKCNLACRMCHPASSNQLIPEWQLSSIESERKEAEAIRKKSQWSHSDASMDLLTCGDLVDPVHLHLAGGEPAIDKKHERVLEYLVASGKSKRITLSYNTNLTHVIPGLKWREHFKKIMILVSIDGVGTVNEYIRHPSRWLDIDHMFRFYLEQANLYSNVQIETNVTVSAYNILHLKELFLYFSQLPSRRPVVPVFTLVQDPQWLKISVLPVNLQKSAKEKLDDLQIIYADEHANVLMQQRLVVFREWLGRAQQDKEMFEMFCQKTEFFDRHRRANIFEIVPQLREHWRPTPVPKSDSLLF